MQVASCNKCERHTQLLHSQKLANAIASPLPQKKNGRPALLSYDKTRFVRSERCERRNSEREVSKGFDRCRSRAVTSASVTRNLHYMQTCIFRIASPLPQKKNGSPVLFLWQGRRDSNTQPMVLETTTLPLSHSPKLPIYFTMRTIKSQMILSVFLKIDPSSSNCSNNAQNSRVSQRNIV